MKKLLILLLCVITALGGAALSACGGSGNSEDNILTFWAYEPQSLEHKNAYNNLLAKFTETTGIQVKPTYIVKDSFNTTLDSTFSSSRKKTPDVFYLDQPRMKEYVTNNKLQDITAEMTSDSSIAASNFMANGLNTCEINGQYYGLPINLSTIALFYNKDLVGATPVLNSFADLQARADEVAATYGNTKAAFEGLGGEGYGAWQFSAFVYAAGGNMVNSNMKASFNDANGQAAAELIRYLYSKSPKAVRTSSNAFGNKNVAFKLASVSDVDSIKKSFPSLNFGAALIPPMTAGADSHSAIGGDNLVIHKGTKRLEEAMKLFKFLSSAESNAIIAEYTANFPSRIENIENEKYNNDPLKSVLKAQLMNAVIRPKHSAWIEINDVDIAGAVAELTDDTSTQTVKQILDTAATAANAKLV